MTVRYTRGESAAPTVAAGRPSGSTCRRCERVNPVSYTHLLRALGPGLPALMVGDFNYPVFQSRLDRHVSGEGYELSLSDKRTYTPVSYTHLDVYKRQVPRA